MKQIHFITYNDTYNGIYQSQVIDVVNHLGAEFNVSIALIAFVPLRLWKSQKAIIKAQLPAAKVYPILGSLDKINRTALFLKLIPNKSFAICRGPLAFVLAKRSSFKKLVYDGRAAVEAEVTEYDVTGSIQLNQLFIASENNAINNADYFISVSTKLIGYWEGKLNKKIPIDQYSIIPCTLTSQKIEEKETIVAPANVKVVYSGGTGAWQSFEKVVSLLDNLLTRQSNLEVLFLTKENSILSKLINKYPERCSRQWLNHNEVFNVLSSCDYGILLREDRMTNEVASPVKFAEYLNAGLKVLISPNIGDFSAFTKENECGVIVNGSLPVLDKVSKLDKAQSKELCEFNFFKTSNLIQESYKKLVEYL